MKAQYKFIFARKGLREGKGLIQLQIYLDRTQRKYVSTKLKVTQAQWDSRHNRIRVTSKTTAEWDQTLKEMVSKLEAYEMKLIRKGESLTADRIDEYFAGKSSEDLITFIRNQLENDNKLKHNTTKGHFVLLRKLEKLYGVIPFETINYDFIVKFDNELHKKLSQNSVTDFHRILKRYINSAIKSNLMTANPYNNRFKLIWDTRGRDSLSSDDLILLENLNLSESLQLSQTRDMFLFCCYTGLRYSDMQNLSREHLQFTPEGIDIVLHRMIKVARPVFLPLYLLFEGKPEVILKRYDYQFPTVSNLKGNQCLKIIAGKAEIKKKITWHTGRHSFCSILATKYNDPYLIMALAGHSELRTSMLYIHSSQEIIKSKLRNSH